MTLRVVTWNCADGFARKAVRIADVAADFLFVPEVREQHSTALGDRYTAEWDGVSGQKGLLIGAKRPWRLEVVHRASARHMLSVKASTDTEEILLVGVWAMPSARGYVGSVVSGLGELPLWPLNANVIVAGDFNASRAFDTQHPQEKHFEQIATRLQARGLQSLWHTVNGEIFGEELTPTYYHQWKRDQPFHIDFMFASQNVQQRLTSITVGKYDDWCKDGSDHMPIIADFE